VNAVCFACGQPNREPREHLCPECWRQLPLGTRTALRREDGQAVRRFRELLQGLRSGTPLGDSGIE